MIRSALIKDVPAFGKIINDCAEFGLMLHRSYAHLYEHLRDFSVAVDDGEVMGVCGLNIVWADLAEVYALAVTSKCRGKGVGRALVEAAVVDARRLGVRRVMALTYEEPFFERLDFKVIDRAQLPLKVWSECLHCSKHQACDEIAMVRVLDDVRVGPAPEAFTPPDDQYVVPVQLNVGGADPNCDAAQRRPRMAEMHK